MSHLGLLPTAHRHLVESTGKVAFISLPCSAEAPRGACDILQGRVDSRSKLQRATGQSKDGLLTLPLSIARFESYACTYSGGMKHHVAFINDISANNLDAADTDDCGQAHSTRSLARLELITLRR